MKIWPLYYFIVILSLFILPKFQVFKIPNLSLDVNNILVLLKVLALFLLMVPNLLVLIKLIQFATQTWSIGTEEQFYAIWPFIIDKVKTLEFLFFAIIILYNLLPSLIGFQFMSDFKYIQLIKSFIQTIQLDSLTIGALGASLLFKNELKLKYLINIYVFFINYK